MKYIIDLRIIIVCAGILSLFACNEDKGNYDYEAINRVTEIANIQESYSVEVGERLLITPELNTTSGNTDNLDYTWYYKSGSAWNVLHSRIMVCQRFSSTFRSSSGVVTGAI